MEGLRGREGCAVLWELHIIQYHHGSQGQCQECMRERISRLSSLCIHHLHHYILLSINYALGTMINVGDVGNVWGQVY